MANLQYKRMRYIRWMLHLNCYIRGGFRMHRVITKQLMYMVLRVTLDLSALDRFRSR